MSEIRDIFENGFIRVVTQADPGDETMRVTIQTTDGRQVIFAVCGQESAVISEIFMSFAKEDV